MNRKIANFGARARWRAYWLNHRQATLFSLQKLAHTPVASGLTILVIAIAFALPTSLYVLLDNLGSASTNWNKGASISLYLHHQIGDQQARQLATELTQRAEIARVSFLSKEQALAEFSNMLGATESLAAMPENPLPAVLIVEPKAASDHTVHEQLATTLQKLEQVEFAEFDQQWVERLSAILELLQRGIGVLAGLLALAVLIVVGNTIRLDILNRQAEIKVVQLVGGTDAYIRRPFLYGGTWMGLLAAGLAWILVGITVWLMGEPSRRLAGLYEASFNVAGLGLSDGLRLLLLGALLGWLGSWLSVGRQLRQLR